MTGVPALRVGVLGPLLVTADEVPVAIAGPRLQALLGVLALRAGQTVSVQQLIDAGWAQDNAPATAIKTVRSHVAHLRQTLRRHGCEEALRPSPPGYRLEVPVTAVDSGRFEEAIRAGRAYRDRGEHAAAAAEFAAALALWRGDPLAGCTLHSWAAAEVTRLQEARLATIEDRAAEDLAAGDHRVAIGELEYLVGVHPFRERLWELLMRALFTDGRQADALATYQRARRLLRDELGVDPGRRLRELEATVLRGDLSSPGAAPPAAGHATTAQALTTQAMTEQALTAQALTAHGATAQATGVQAKPPPPSGRVPSPVTPLVGRLSETAAAAKLVVENRLVTLSGFGGAGKTRVAIAVCQQVPERDPVVFVDLAAIADPALVAPTVAGAIGVPDHALLPLAESIAEHYAGRRPLLVLDNCEHLVDECARLVGELLAGCGQLHVLTTSRQVLRIPGEAVYRLPALPVPDPTTVRSGADLAGYEGVDLFARRAGIGDVTALSPAEARALATVCARVDGLPLALELAAARASVLSLTELAVMLTGL
ncbi:MAG TPA: BTAD domain-containing putative transcriptional regulator, partial [Pseudonocardiaceae bacterium]|nr:BTAD domain-containing putative transcriptional regulator [Pseudonocardiaceae bacterium]